MSKECDHNFIKLVNKGSTSGWMFFFPLGFEKWHKESIACTKCGLIKK